MKTQKIAESLRQVSRKIASRWDDGAGWKLVDEIGWGTKTTDYKKIKEKLMSEYSMEEMDGFTAWVESKYSRLSKVIDDYVEEEDGSHDLPYGGDDSFEDLVHHVIGMGKAVYDRAMKDPSTLKKLKVEESFAYAVPSSYDYKRKMPFGERVKQEIASMEDSLQALKRNPLSKGLEQDLSTAEKIVASLKDDSKDAEDLSREMRQVRWQMEDRLKEIEKEFESFKSAVKSVGFSFEVKIEEIALLRKGKSW